MIAETDSYVLHGRVVVIGDPSVGKTSILNQLIDRNFNPYEHSTVGANYQLYTQDVDGVRVEIQIWDTAGQEKFKSLGPIYFRNSIGALAVYDITNLDSFNNLQEWIRSFIEVAGSDVIICIVGNKCDLSQRVVTQEDATKLFKSSSNLENYFFFETSAKTGYGINELFENLAKELVKFKSSSEEVTQKVSTPSATAQKKNNCACNGFN